MHVKSVPLALWKTFESTNSPVTLIGLLPHEHKMCVVNAVLKRTVNNDEPIKSKERLIFQCGYRRFIVNPVFSQHTNGKKHKVSIVFSSKFSWFYTNFLVRTILSTKLDSGGYFLCPDPVPTITSFVLQRSWRKAGVGGTWKFAIVQPQQTCNQKSCFIRYAHKTVWKN